MLPVAIKARMCLGSLHFRRIFISQEVIFILLYIFLHTPPTHFGKWTKDRYWVGGGEGGAISKLANVFNSCQVGKRQGNGGGGGGGGGGGEAGGRLWVILKNISCKRTREQKKLL